MAKNTGSKEPLIVYWGLFAEQHNLHRINLMWEPPVPVLSHLNQKSNPKEHKYMACYGTQQLLKNSYALIHPASSEASFVKTEKGLVLDRVEGFPGWLRQEEYVFSNRGRVTYDFGWLFFCEEPLIVNLTPAYMHETLASRYGTIAAGAFDISRWFRPLFLDYLLWENINEIKIRKGDPACYISFQTDRKVVLKQFETTAEIYSLGGQTTEHKNFFPKESLNTLYNRFTRSNRHKVLAKLIKDNLLE